MNILSLLFPPACLQQGAGFAWIGGRSVPQDIPRCLGLVLCQVDLRENQSPGALPILRQREWNRERKEGLQERILYTVTALGTWSLRPLGIPEEYPALQGRTPGY